MPPSAAGAYSALQNFNTTRETPEAATSTADAKYGVSGLSTQLDQLRGLTGNLQTAIGNVAPSVAGRTSGSLVTQAARDAITNNETQPLTDQFNKVSTNLSDVNSQYQNATGLASNYASSLLTGDKQKYDELFGNYTTLAGQEADAAKQAEAKREFDAQLAASKASAAAASISGLSLGGGASGTAPTAAAPTLNDHLMADIQNFLPADYATKFNPGYTERLIQRLQNTPQYASLANQIPAIVYAYRKPYEIASAPTAATSSGGSW